MSKVRIYARNLAANWIGYGVNLVLILVLSWFAFRLLGDVRYGVWSLVISLTGYLGMVDAGLRPALYRHFNWYLGRKQPMKVNEVLCTGLAFFAGSTLVLVAAGAVLGSAFGDIFPKTPAEYLSAVQIALVIVAANVGLSMISAVFGSLLETNERFDLANALQVSVAGLRVGGSILVLKLGYGLVGLAAAGAASTLLACVGGYLLASRAFPPLRIRRAFVKRATLAELIRFGIPCFFSGIGIRIMLYTGGLIIAWLIGLKWVGYYSLATMLLEYSKTLVRKGTTVFTPEIQQSLARGDLAGLRHFLPLVIRVAMVFGVLIVVGIMAFGRDFLTLFYGTAVGEAGGPVVVILGFAYLMALAADPCTSTLIGAGRVKLVAAIVMLEAAINVGLTILLLTVGGMGLEGVALGTMIPRVLLSGLVFPAVAARHLQMRPHVLARQTAAYWVPGAALFALACLALLQLPASLTWGWFAAKVCLATAAYLLIGWFLIFPRDVRRRMSDKVRPRGGLHQEDTAPLATARTGEYGGSGETGDGTGI